VKSRQQKKNKSALSLNKTQLEDKEGVINNNKRPNNAVIIIINKKKQDIKSTGVIDRSY
jgi:hypothetical protein